MASFKMWVYVSAIAFVVIYVILSWEYLQKSFTSSLHASSVNKTKTETSKNITELFIEVEGFPSEKKATPSSSHFVEDLPLEFRMCRLVDPHPPVLGEPPISKLEFRNATTGGFHLLQMQYFRYQCAGDRYEQFMQEHQFPYVMNRHLSYENWGTRQTIVPLNKKKNSGQRHVLVMGNSHTRQMIGSMLCQYHEQIQSSRKLSPGDSGDVHDEVQYTLFGGKLILTVLNNHPIFYSYRWKEYLEDKLGLHDLDEDHIDAIVLGKFNQYAPQFENTTMWSAIFDYGRHHPEYKIDPSRFKPFQFRDLAKQYKGPIIWSGILAGYGDFSHDKVVGQMSKIASTTDRTNLRSVYARQHASAMGNVECSTNNHDRVDTCVANDTKANQHVYLEGHRCMGAKGGQPDLVAWDVIEALYDVL